MEFSHDCGSCRRDQFKWNVGLPNRDTLKDFKDGRCRQRIHTVGRTERAFAVDQARKIDSLNLKRFNADAAEDDIDDRVERADLVKLNFFDGCSMNL